MSGAIPFTLTPRPATSTPSERVKWTTAALNAAYTGSGGYARTPSIELTFTIGAATPLEHVGKEGVGHGEDVQQVDLIERLPMGRIAVEELLDGQPVTDIVDQHVDAALLQEHLLAQPCHVLGSPDVGGDPDRVPSPLADATRRGLGRLPVDVGDVHRCPVLGEELGRRKAYAGRRSGDDGDLILE